MLKIAMIDTGVCEQYQKELYSHVFVDENHKVREETGTGNSGVMHGTICFLILKHYCKDALICSIRILDHLGSGFIRKLEPALEWCLQNEVSVVNMSFGSTHFKDKKFIRTLINYYGNSGLCIIAASCNNGLISYPSSFSNVIGVSGNISNLLSIHNNVHTGVNFSAPSRHQVEFFGYKITTESSSSYAAPFMTALTVNSRMESGNTGIHQIKRILRKLGENMDGNIPNPYVPDWITCAYIPRKLGESKASYYFTSFVESSYEEVREAVDTIIVRNKEDYNLYKHEKKHIVYLGSENIEFFSTDYFIWSRINRKEQILQSVLTEDRIPIPIIAVKFDNNLDRIYPLTILKQHFGKDGYHAYTASTWVESLLYDLEYIPDTMLDLAFQKVLQGFLFWQTYYGQCDIIVMDIGSADFSVIQGLGVQLQCSILQQEEGMLSIQLTDNVKRYTINAEIKSEESGIQELYVKLITLLSEDTEDEQGKI